MTLSRIENGKRRVSVEELVALAACLELDLDRLLKRKHRPAWGQRFVALSAVLPEMRADREVASSVKTGLRLCGLGTALRQRLGRAWRPNLPNYAASRAHMRLSEAPVTLGRAIRQGEEAAAGERTRQARGAGPASDHVDALEAQGLWVAAAALPDSVSGLCISDGRVGLLLIVNGSYHVARQRLAVAHEYAHALFGHARTVSATRAEGMGEWRERRAAAFAAAFLLPPDGVPAELARLGKGRGARREWFGFSAATDDAGKTALRASAGAQRVTHADVGLIARRFGVGYRATVWRLVNLNHISPRQAQRLIAQRDRADRFLAGAYGHGFDAARTGGRRARSAHWYGTHPEEHHRRLRGHIAHLAVEAFRRKRITRDRLYNEARVAGFSGSELLDFARHL